MIKEKISIAKAESTHKLNQHTLNNMDTTLSVANHMSMILLNTVNLYQYNMHFLQQLKKSKIAIQVMILSSVFMR